MKSPGTQDIHSCYLSFMTNVYHNTPQEELTNWLLPNNKPPHENEATDLMRDIDDDKVILYLVTWWSTIVSYVPFSWEQKL